PYIGAVTGTNVYVRSGPGEADGRNDYYQCAKLSRPANVTVVGRMNNWLKILAPPGCYSVIFAKYVDPDETSKTGVVTGDDVRVRAGGTEHEVNFWQPHGKLNKGDTVEILEKATDRWGDWYKIASPHSAHFWIYAKYVTPLGDPKLEGPTPPPTEPSTAPKAPAVIPSPAPKKAPPPEVKPAPPVTEDAAALLTKIKQIEKQLRAEYDKPAPQRNFKDLLAKYRRIKVADDSFAKPWLDARIEFLQNAIRKRQELASAKSIIEQTEAKQELLQMHRTQLTKDAEAAAAARGYPAEGILMASELFIGGLAHPKRFLLRDPSSLRIRAYVQSTGGKIDLNGYAGMYVGVRGPIRYDEKLAVNIIEAETVTVIKQHARLASPAEPTVRPRRIPRPKPAPPELPTKEPATPPAPVAPEPEPLVK
ncbi:MAG: SH3 domain-containing protein, partial [Phycisphaerae bacterium]|nr:SH3 domain-containing protein [Phycisphaerae bacterium]